MPQTSVYLCSKTQLYNRIVSRVAASYVAVVKSDSDIHIYFSDITV